MYQKFLVPALAAVAALTLVAIGEAQVWNEVGDAGDLPATAQSVAGSSSQPLTRIIGATNWSGGDRIDMYQIYITDPVGFEAWTSAAGGGVAIWDTRLYLFDESGRGLLANDDHDWGDFQSGVFPPATDATAQTIPGVGRYYLAITSFDTHARSHGLNICHFESDIEISGPDGSGAVWPVENWWAFSNWSGSYEIALQGAAFVVEYELGDLNCDGAFNGADIDPFFLALGNPALYEQQFPNCDILLGDMNCDGRVDGGDIDEFFRCLGVGGCVCP